VNRKLVPAEGAYTKRRAYHGQGECFVGGVKSLPLPSVGFVAASAARDEHASASRCRAAAREVYTMRQLLTVVYLVGFGAQMHGQNTPKAATGNFAGEYRSLKPEQKALVDDWMKRFSETIGKPVDPQMAYDNLPVSTRTTFNAVTQALLATQLTDARGSKLGSAMQIIDKVDTVHGAIPGTRGDEQFRIYVQLKPGALELLAKSQEFRREDDNTVYHKGYPICYRSRPPVPSIQVSATRDGTRADLDIDYKASGLPKALVNGHLTASNSDVRAGHNYDTHISQWQGLNNWWRSLLLLAPVNERNVEKEKQSFPTEPRQAAHGKPAEAVHDLLNTWLVEKKPEDILSYFARESYYCAELEQGEKGDQGMAKFKLLIAMQQANRRLGNPAKLTDISTAVPVGTAVRVKLVKQPYEQEFALYDVREDAAEQFKCANRLDASLISSKAAESKAFGKYYGAVFRVGGRNGVQGTTLATLWAREAKRWQLISYDVDPEWDEYRAPNTAKAPPAPAPTTYTQAPAGLVEASDKFLEAWLVRRDFDQALKYLSSRCADCVKLNVAAEERQPQTAEDAQVQLQSALRRVTETTGTVTRLDEAIASPQVNHEDIKLVQHRNSNAYAIASIPDYMARALDCSSRTAGEPVSFNASAGEKSYGKYYAMGLRLVKAGEDSGVLVCVWAQEGGAWKIIAYTVLTS
jgi:hypothetical protein